MAQRTAAIEVDPELIRRFGVNGPRYTSYPTADRFVEAFDANAHASWLERRNIGGISTPLSVYVHIPFCQSICYYCACNKIITKDHSRSERYLRYLARETEMQTALLGDERRISQLHWGGGTPTFLSQDEMSTLMAMLRDRFEFTSDGEYAIEIDPRTTPPATIEHLARLGFNRMSLGVQDFDPDVQRAVNRIQPADMTLTALRVARANGFRSINFDLIYGLPKQSMRTFARTLELVLDAEPDRIALYSYAHLPERFKPQRRIHETELPSAEERLKIFELAVRTLSGAGYDYIGLDHFARPDDELSVARRTGRLHRNFQGYSTRANADSLALGVSAISKIGPIYSQNAYELDDYYDAIDQGRLPILRGLELSRDDLVRRSVIMALMCQGEVSFESIEISHLISFSSYFERELESLREYERLGLVEIDDEWLSVTPRGRLLVRVICMVFDKYLRQTTQARYSKVI